MSHDIAFLLKNIQLKSGLEVLKPADCELLNKSIKKKINKMVSLIVLLRLFGFAASKFPPTIYNLDILSSYCGYQNWKAFCDDHLN